MFANNINLDKVNQNQPLTCSADSGAPEWWKSEEFPVSSAAPNVAPPLDPSCISELESGPAALLVIMTPADELDNSSVADQLGLTGAEGKIKEYLAALRGGAGAAEISLLYDETLEAYDQVFYLLTTLEKDFDWLPEMRAKCQLIRAMVHQRLAEFEAQGGRGIAGLIKAILEDEMTIWENWGSCPVTEPAPEPKIVCPPEPKEVYVTDDGVLDQPTQPDVIEDTPPVPQKAKENEQALYSGSSSVPLPVIPNYPAPRETSLRTDNYRSSSEIALERLEEMKAEMASLVNTYDKITAAIRERMLNRQEPGTVLERRPEYDDPATV